MVLSADNQIELYMQWRGLSKFLANDLASLVRTWIETARRNAVVPEAKWEGTYTAGQAISVISYSVMNFS